MATRRRPQPKRFPTYLRRAFDAIPEETRIGPIVLVVRDRGTRRVYCRAIAKRGGVVANLVFAVAPSMPDSAASDFRRMVGPGTRVLDVRDFRDQPLAGRG
jgi:hypothetical protein